MQHNGRDRRPVVSLDGGKTRLQGEVVPLGRELLPGQDDALQGLVDRPSPDGPEGDPLVFSDGGRDEPSHVLNI